MEKTGFDEFDVEMVNARLCRPPFSGFGFLIKKINGVLKDAAIGVLV